MPERVLTEGEFNTIKQALLAQAPDNLDEAGFQRWFQPRFDGAIAEAEHSNAPVSGSALRRFIGGAAQMLNPVTAVKGVYQAVRHPVQTYDALADASAEQFVKAKDAAGQGRYSEAAAHGIAGVVPGIGPVVANIGEQIGSGDIAGGAGAAAGILTPLSAAKPIVAGVAKATGKTAVPLVRSAIKPTVTAMRQQTGGQGINAAANKLASFIADRGITSREAAQSIVDAAEANIQTLAKSATVATDAPQRAQRYLKALSQSASRQGLPADDIAIIRAKAAELLNESPLSETVMTTQMQPSPTGLVTASGQPVMVPTQVPSRALRTDVMPDEALELARGGGKWGNRKSWGEQKGASREASKAVERAERDAVKAAVPETRAQLREQGQAIQARETMDRMAFREGNREPFSPFDATTAAVEIGTGNLPVLSAARHFLRQNKLKMGVWARRLEKAIVDNDDAAAAVILDRFGVERGVGATTSPSESQIRTTEPAWSTP